MNGYDQVPVFGAVNKEYLTCPIHDVDVEDLAFELAKFAPLDRHNF